MGAWGYFDDDNDYVSDVWIYKIVCVTAPYSIIRLMKEDPNINTQMINDFENKFAENNPELVYSTIKKYIETEKESQNKSGIILRAIRVYSADPYSKNLPKTLPNSFPKDLLAEALKANVKTLVTEDFVGKGWKDVDERKRALHAQQKLFSL
jgi:hypothetical protein